MRREVPDRRPRLIPMPTETSSAPLTPALDGQLRRFYPCRDGQCGLSNTRGRGRPCLSEYGPTPALDPQRTLPGSLCITVKSAGCCRGTGHHLDTKPWSINGAAPRHAIQDQSRGRPVDCQHRLFVFGGFLADLSRRSCYSARRCRFAFLCEWLHTFVLDA